MADSCEPVSKKSKITLEIEDITDTSSLEVNLKHTDETIVIDEPAAESEISDRDIGFATENDVGISEYMNITVGFTGVIKQRYSDFVVNEIDVNGEVVRLTSYDLPPVEPSTQEVDEGVLSAEDRDKLGTLAESPDIKAVLVLKEENDKEARTRIHRAVKLLYPDLDSNTEEREGVKVVVVKLKKNKGQGQWRNAWPRERPDYLQFVLYKENKDTMDAVDLLPKHLHLKPGLFAYAGTKDRRAKTSQLITAYRVPAEKMVRASKSLYSIGIGNYKYVKEPLRLGQLSGNKFTIVLRNVKGKEDDINTALASLKQHGFVNYYGMQRFGTTTIPTHHIGRALLRSNWQEAIDLILNPRPHDRPEMVEFRKIWQSTKDAKKALQRLTKYACIEKSLLIGLLKHGTNNPTGALNCISRNTRLMYAHSYQSYVWNKISRNTRLMYAHSYQSYVWNKVVSRRLSQLGHKPIIGDLVRPARQLNVQDGEESAKDAPIVLTNENISSYTIYDVVLPQPGYSIIYPDNQVRVWYQEIMEADNINIDNMRHKQKDYSLPGSYRHIAVQTKDMEWSLVRYTDNTKALVVTDWELLNGVSLPPNSNEGKLLAVKLELSLPPSTYATMALREVLLMDTSSAHQSTLNST